MNNLFSNAIAVLIKLVDDVDELQLLLELVEESVAFFDVLFVAVGVV